MGHYRPSVVAVLCLAGLLHNDAEYALPVDDAFCWGRAAQKDQFGAAFSWIGVAWPAWPPVRSQEAERHLACGEPAGPGL
jgi:hypothetical protein